VSVSARVASVEGRIIGAVDGHGGAVAASGCATSFEV
jgi:hypothetical protein